MVVLATRRRLTSSPRPCHHIPGLKATPKVIEITEENHARIEEAFRRYFYREPLLEADLNEEFTNKQEHPRQQHEFDIIICHANVIRYFVCRCVKASVLFSNVGQF